MKKWCVDSLECKLSFAIKIISIFLILGGPVYPTNIVKNHILSSYIADARYTKNQGFAYISGQLFKNFLEKYKTICKLIGMCTLVWC